jgi:hypothetical protein
MIGQPAFHGTRVFTTEGTENTEGQRRKAIFAVLKNCFSPHPLSVLCALCGEHTLVMTQHELVTPCLGQSELFVEGNDEG